MNKYLKEFSLSKFTIILIVIWSAVLTITS